MEYNDIKMRSEQEGMDKLRRLKINLEAIKEEYNNLDQISMQGNEGAQYRKEINETESAIKLAKWILQTD